MLSAIFFAFMLAWIVAMFIWLVVTWRGVSKAIYGQRKGHGGEIFKALAPAFVALVGGTVVLFLISFMLRSNGM